MMKYAKIKYLVAFCVAAQVTAVCAAATDAQRVKKGFDRKAGLEAGARASASSALDRRPAQWRISPALPARTRYVLIEIDDISPNKLASIEEVEIQSAARGD